MTKPATARTRTATDPEIAAISRIGRIIAELDPAAQARVLQFVHSKFCPKAPETPAA